MSSDWKQYKQAVSEQDAQKARRILEDMMKQQKYMSAVENPEVLKIRKAYNELRTQDWYKI